MRTSDQLKQIKDALELYLIEAGSGHAVVAQDPYQIVDILRQSPGQIKAVVMYHSEVKRGEFEEAGFVDRTFWVVISRSRGLKLEPGASLTDGVSGGPAMFDIVDDARDVLRGLEFAPETTEVHIDYKGAEPFSVEGYLTDAYKLEFSIGTQLPEPTTVQTESE